jgi:hypothetical protein
LSPRGPEIEPGARTELPEAAALPGELGALRGEFLVVFKGGKFANFRSGLSQGQLADNGHSLLDAGLSDTQTRIPPAEIDQIDVLSRLGIIAFTIAVPPTPPTQDFQGPLPIQHGFALPRQELKA